MGRINHFWNKKKHKVLLLNRNGPFASHFHHTTHQLVTEFDFMTLFVLMLHEFLHPDYTAENFIRKSIPVHSFVQFQNAKHSFRSSIAARNGEQEWYDCNQIKKTFYRINSIDTQI